MDILTDPSNRTLAAAPVGGVSFGWMPYLVLAILFGSYLGINAVIGNSHADAWKPMLWELSSSVVIFAMVPLIIRFEQRFRVDSRPRWRVIRAHAGAVVVFSAIHVAGILMIRDFVYWLVGQHYNFGTFPFQEFYEFQKDLITYLTILVVIFAIREFQVRRSGELRAAELSAELSQARLRHLTAQIEPHFLFNTLNAISNRMHEDIEAADRMISDLGALLRAAYESDNHVLVPLERELQWLRGYAAMMSERFRGQLSFELKVAPGLEAIAVPRLILQPLVENALTHGLAAGRGSLCVDVVRQGSQLQYTVSDDGVGIKDTVIKPGTGLSNVARRLELLFPGEHKFTLQAREPCGTLVTLSFPVSS